MNEWIGYAAIVLLWLVVSALAYFFGSPLPSGRKRR